MKKHTLFILTITLAFLFAAMINSNLSGQDKKAESKIQTEQKTPASSSKSSQLDIKVVLDGGFIPNQGLPMNTSLQWVGIPLSQPFNPQLPYYGNSNPLWLYNGPEILSAIPSNMVDWILVELRDAPDAPSAIQATVIKKMAILLLDDGNVVDLDGINMPTFDETITQNLYIVIYHRNHLAVMSAYPLVESGGVYSYDFTTGPDKVYGGYLGCVEIVPGLWGLASGDGNADNQVNNLDRIEVWSVDAAMSGYLAGDYILDGQVNGPDIHDYWRPNVGKMSQIP